MVAVLNQIGKQIKDLRLNLNQAAPRRSSRRPMSS